MSSKTHKDLKQILHPYLFVLKEGKEISDDYLDYSLLMLHVNCTEILHAPKIPKRELPLKASKAEVAPALQETEQERIALAIPPRAKA